MRISIIAILMPFIVILSSSASAEVFSIKCEKYGKFIVNLDKYYVWNKDNDVYYRIYKSNDKDVEAVADDPKAGNMLDKNYNYHLRFTLDRYTGNLRIIHSHAPKDKPNLLYDYMGWGAYYSCEKYEGKIIRSKKF